MKVLLSKIDQEKCKESYKTYKLMSDGIRDTQFCAGELEGKKDTCQVSFDIINVVLRFWMCFGFIGLENGFENLIKSFRNKIQPCITFS